MTRPAGSLAEPPPGTAHASSQPGALPGALPGGEFALTDANFRAIAAMLHADAGIALAPAKSALVYSRLAKRLRALELPGFDAYCALVAGPDGAEERRRMLTALTTNVTRFFREPHHFEHLRTRVLPGLLDRARRGERVRIWSAACSTGQEPWSVALTVLSLAPDAGRLDVRVLATDIDPAALAEARAGRYGAACLAPVPPELRQRWFAPAAPAAGACGPGEARAWEAGEALRALVAFRELNLVGPWPMRGPFQVILCRNVVIYFDDATQSRLWQRFTPLLEPAGHLYIGHSERLSGPAASHYVSAGLTIHRREARAGRPAGRA